MVNGLVVSAPATMGVEVQAFVHMACGWVKLVQLLLAEGGGVTMGEAGGGGFTIEPQAQLLPGVAPRPPIASGPGGRGFDFPNHRIQKPKVLETQPHVG